MKKFNDPIENAAKSFRDGLRDGSSTPEASRKMYLWAVIAAAAASAIYRYLTR